MKLRAGIGVLISSLMNQHTFCIINNTTGPTQLTPAMILLYVEQNRSYRHALRYTMKKKALNNVNFNVDSEKIFLQANLGQQETFTDLLILKVYRRKLLIFFKGCTICILLILQSRQHIIHGLIFIFNMWLFKNEVVQMGFSFAGLKIKSCQTQQRINRALGKIGFALQVDLTSQFPESNPNASQFFFSPYSSQDKILGSASEEK